MIRKKTKLVREGKYAAEVPVDLIEEEGDWSPYLRWTMSRSLMGFDWRFAKAISRPRRNTAACSS